MVKIEKVLNYTGIYDQDDDAAILKQFQYYGHCQKDITFKYEYDSTDSLLEMLSSQGLIDEVEKISDELMKLITIRNWVHYQLIGERSYYLTNVLKENKWNSVYILGVSKEHKYQFDCGTYAMVLCEVLLALGYKARWVQCLPLDLRFSDSHCITLVYFKPLNKWIILDAALNCCYFNGNGDPISLAEFRQIMLHNKKVTIIGGQDIDTELLCWYWEKNLIRFHCYAVNKFGFISVVEEKIRYYLNPEGFNIKDKMIKKGDHDEIIINTNNDELFWRI